MINHSFLKKHFELEEDSDYWIWKLKEKVETFAESGYISKSKYKYFIKKTQGVDTYNLTLQFQENPLIKTILVVNQTKADTDILLEILEENDFAKGKIANKKNYIRGKKKFLKYYQKQGLFLIEIIEDLFSTEEPHKIKLQLTLKPIKSFFIDFIKVEGTKNISYSEVLTNLNFTFHQKITSNKVLDDSYIKIKQLGLFSSVFFKLQKVNPPNKKKLSQDKHYDLIIEVEEIDGEALVTSTEIRSEVGPVFLAHYVNLNIAGERDRVLAQFGYEADLSTVIFILEYTKPDLFDKYFFSIRVQKEDFISSVSDTVDKLSEIYFIRLTTGYQFIDFLSGYLVFKESYFKESTIDYLSREEVATPSGVTLRNDLFQTQLGFILIYNSLNDNFNPNRGIRTAISYDIIPKSDLAQILNSQTDFYFSISRSITIGFFFQGSSLFTNDSDTTLYPYGNHRTNVQNRELQAVRATLFGSLELRFSTRFLHEYSYFVTFFETGGLWDQPENIDPEDLGLGVGIGLRWAPNKYNHSFLFGFPGSINIGIKLTKNDYKSPSFTLLQHRDQYFYINLTGGF